MNKGRTLISPSQLVLFDFGRDIMELLDETERNINKLPRIGTIFLICLLLEPILITNLPTASQFSSELRMYFGLMAGIVILTLVFLVNQDILPKRLINAGQVVGAISLALLAIYYFGDSYVNITIGQQKPEVISLILRGIPDVLVTAIKIFSYSGTILLTGLQLSRLIRWGLTKSDTSNDSVKREILLWSKSVEELLSQESILAGNSQRIEKQFLEQIKTQFDLKIESRNIQEDFNDSGKWFPDIMEEMYTEIYNEFVDLYKWPIKSKQSSAWKSWLKFVNQNKVKQYVRENYNSFCIHFLFEPERMYISSKEFWKVMLMVDGINSGEEVRKVIRDQFSLTSKYLNEQVAAGSGEEFEKKALFFMQTVYAEYSLKKNRPILDTAKNLIRKSMVVNVIDLLEENKEYAWKYHRRAAVESFSQGGLEFSWSLDKVCNPTIKELIKRHLLYLEGNLFLPREESSEFINSNEQKEHRFVQDLISLKKKSGQI